MNLKNRTFNLQLLKENPVKALTKLIGLESEMDFILKNQEKTFPIIVGIIVYRQLSSFEKRKVLEQAAALDNSKFLGRVQSIIALNIVQPYWNAWSLSDTELRNWTESNKSIVGLLDHSFTIEAPMTLAGLAALIYSLSELGVKDTVKDLSSKHVAEKALKKMGFGNKHIARGGLIFFYCGSRC